MTGEGVCEREFVIASELGLHARPAGRLVAVASRFRACIEIGRGEEWVDADSVLSLLSLGASRGTAVRIRAVGEDAEQAVAALGRLLESRNEAEAERLAGAAAGGAPD